LARFNTTFRLHQKATKVGWYKKWHEKKYSHHVHTATAIIFLLTMTASAVINLIPSKEMLLAANGSWSQATFNGTTDGTYANTAPYNTSADVGLSGMSALSNNGGGAWQYKRPITVTNGSGGALTDYQLQVNPFTDASFLNNTGLVGSWHMNESTGTTMVADLSGNGNGGNVTGGPTFASAKYGNGIMMNGASQYVELPNESLYDVGAFTISAWVNMTDVTGNHFIASKYRDAAGSDVSYRLQMIDGKFEFAAYGDTTGSVYHYKMTNTTYSTGTWYYVTAAYDGGATISSIKIFVNGSEVTDVTPESAGNFVALSNSAQPFRIGTGNSAGTNTYLFAGTMDEVKLFNRGLTPTEVANRYNLGAPKVRDDYQDIRFTKADGTTELSYWQDTDGKYWVKYSGSLGTGDTVINMYYGNSGATFGGSYANNGANTFHSFDNFDSYSVGALNGQGGWTGNTLYSVSNSKSYNGSKSVYATNNGGVSPNAPDIVSGNYAAKKNFTTNWYVFHEGGVSVGLGSLFICEDSTVISRLITDSNGVLYDENGALGFTLTAGKWYRFQVSIKDDNSHNIIIFDGDTQVLNLPNRANAANMINGANKTGFYHDFRFNTAYLDDLIIREYASTEPTHTAPGAEGGTYSSPGTFLSGLVPDSINPTHAGKVYQWSNLEFTHCDEGHTVGCSGTFTGTTLHLHVYQSDGVTLVPDADLAGNAAGFTATPIPLTSLNNGNYAVKYPAIKIRADLATTNASYTPYLNDLTTAYSYDITAPTAPTNVQVNPTGWAMADPYIFTWSASTDAESGLAKYQYKLGNGVWTDNSPLTVTTTTQNHYQDGINYFYVRAVDNVGNFSSEVQKSYKFSGNVNPPTNLAVDYSQSQGQTVNLLKFSWTAPVGVNPIGYYYSVNVLPTPENTAYTTNNSTPFGAFAKTNGVDQTFYVVTQEDSGNVGWNTPASVTFIVNTVAPDVPVNIRITDASDRGSSNWALTVVWAPLTGQPPGFDGYEAWRCIAGCANNANYTKVATVATNIYSEAGLSNTTEYFYKVKSRDNAGNTSGFSAGVSKTPTGNYINPPNVTSGPSVTARAMGATIDWTTDRASSSKVYYGSNNTVSCPGTGFGSDSPVTAHTVDLAGLTPGTTYKYRVQSLDEHRDYPGGDGDACSEERTFTTLAAPGISDVTISEIRLTTAIITWKTTSSATSKIMYGTSTAYGQTYTDSSGSQVTTHTVQLTGLSDSTTYNFKIQGTDVDGNTLNSDNYIFTTLTFPRLSDLKVEQVNNTPTSTVKVSFNSNVPATAQVNVTGDGGKSAATYDLKTIHEVTIPGLKDDTPYTVVVQARDQYGNNATSLSEAYKTQFDTRPPEISDITTETDIVGFGLDAKGQVIVSWTTDEPATSQVEYGPGATGSDYAGKTQEDSTLTQNLKTSAPYHFRVVSEDNAKNQAKSSDNSVLTDQASESVIDLIIKSLQSTIGWIFNAFGR
jgi:hypothetical protein